MRIGILTFHRAANFGAQLQAYALKKFIGDASHECEIVDYWPPYHVHAYRVFHKESFHGVISLAREIVISICRGIKYSHHRHFGRKFLGYTDNIRYNDCSALNDLDLDTVIYGSDQIWRKTREGSFDTAYWGEGIKDGIHKVAYAPSAGFSGFIHESDHEFIREHICKFEAVSARERSLAEVLTHIGGKDVPVVLDPVFLIPADSWKPLCGKHIPTSPYILYYRLLPCDAADKYAARLSKESGLRVIVLNGGLSSYHHINSATLRYGPGELPELIRNARCVVTTSFHGVAFSIIFRKNFYYYSSSMISERISSLLDVLGLSDRMIDGNCTPPGIPMPDCSYDEQRIAKEIARSQDYLKKQCLL